MNPRRGPTALLVLVLLAIAPSACEGTSRTSLTRRILGGPCEACETVVLGMPSQLASHARIAPADEPGESMTIEGVVRDKGGKPRADIIVYAYHTDAHGIYPDSDIPQHVHMYVIESGTGYYWIDDIVFRDDPRLETVKPSYPAPGRGGSGVATPMRDADGRWHVTRDIVLGAGISDYPGSAGR